MAFSSDYHSHRHPVFGVPAARRGTKPEQPVPETFRRDTELIDAEFSEMGRSPRFLPGWYILPGVVLGVIIVVALVLAVA